jgi:L-serine/L-threonine ammonia-lyase
MTPLHIETPLLEAHPLSARAARTVWLKLETAQPPGSFKIRGIGFACEEYVRRGAKRLISSSGGNAGIAVAYAGHRLSVPVVVVVPETTTERAIALMRQEGADVTIHGASWQEANAMALSIVNESDAFLHPFDDPLVWHGHATMIDEVARSGVKPDVVVLSVGGGGLLCGVVEGLRRNGWTNVPVLAVETEGADSFAQSVEMGHPVELAAITSIATSLGARMICDQAFSLSKEHPTRSIVVSDKAAVSACERFLTDHQILVEPACGASLAIVYDDVPELEPFRSVLVIVCGGATTTADQLHQWSKQYA